LHVNVLEVNQGGGDCLAAVTGQNNAPTINSFCSMWLCGVLLLLLLLLLNF